MNFKTSRLVVFMTLSRGLMGCGFLLSLLFFAQAYAADNTILAIGQSRALAQSNKYQSAFDVLQKADLKNENPDIAMEKTSLLMKGYLFSLNFKMFSLRDLGPNEKVENLRGQEGTSNIVLFNPEDVLGKLIKSHPDDWRLYQALGEYYFQCFLHCASGDKEDENTLALAEKNCHKAFDHGVSSAKSLYVLGFVPLEGKDPKTAIYFLEKSKALDPKDADCVYNLAYAYLLTDKFEECVANAKESVSLYQKPNLKADAERMLGDAYLEKGSLTESLAHLQACLKIEPDDFNAMKMLLSVQLKMADWAGAVGTAGKMMELGPTNPTSLDEVYRAYGEASQLERYLVFLGGLKTRYAGKTEALGNIWFHEAQCQFENRHDEEAKRALLAARGYFSKCLKADHPVFKVIADTLAALAKNEKKK